MVAECESKVIEAPSFVAKATTLACFQLRFRNWNRKISLKDRFYVYKKILTLTSSKIFKKKSISFFLFKRLLLYCDLKYKIGWARFQTKILQ